MPAIAERDAIYADILAHPEDDALRSVYADHLEEHGDANALRQADFIRIQLAIYALTRGQFLILPESPRGRHVAKLEQMANGLFAVAAEGAMQADALLWSLWLPGEIGGHSPCALRWEGGDLTAVAYFDRGFVSRIACRQQTWLHCGKALVRNHPIEDVSLSDCRPWLEMDEYDNCAWVRSSHGAPAATCDLSPPLFEMLPGGKRLAVLEGLCALYANPKDAFADLSRACLLYAREV